MRKLSIGAAVLLGFLGCRDDSPLVGETGGDVSPPAEEKSRTRTEFRNTSFTIHEGVVLEIDDLNGRLLPTGDDTPPTFDNPETFLIEIENATVHMTPSSMAALLNGYVFAVEDAPIERLQVEIEPAKPDKPEEKDKLKIKGGLKKGIEVPVELEGEIMPTPEGDVRVHTTSVEAVKLPVKGLLGLLGVDVAELINSDKSRGVRVEGDDLILDPEQALPPPRIRGMVTDARIENGAIQLRFGDLRKSERESQADSAKQENYMFFQGGTIRFGKLTMRDSDLRLIDDDPKDWFDFSLKQYNRQLVAGHSKSTPDFGLVVHMPDLGDIGETTEPRPGSQ